MSNQTITQQELMNMKLIIADLNIQLYQAHGQVFALTSQAQELTSRVQELTAQVKSLKPKDKKQNKGK